MIRTTLALIILLIPGAYAYAGKVCSELMRYEKVRNSQLPAKMDEITRLMQVIVNCDSKTISFRKQLLADKGGLTRNWKKGITRNHIQNHCGNGGITATYGWSVIDIFIDEHGNHMASIIARPEDC